MNRLYYRGATIILIVYDITDYSTFNKVQFWIEEIRNHGDSDRKATLILVANKLDLNEYREVTIEIGKRYAQTIGAYFFEVSAAQPTGIGELFQSILDYLPPDENVTQAHTFSIEQKPPSKKPSKFTKEACC